MNLPTLAIIVPCYNEEEVLPVTTKRLLQVLTRLIDESKISNNSYILYVNDGSSDNTWSLIKDFYKQENHVCGMSVAINCGHQNALIAGLSIASQNCDMAVTIDADLQDDEQSIHEMVQKYQEGCDIVYGVRRSRASDNWFKRNSAIGFYRVLELLGVKSVYNHADFRLMSKRAISYLLQFRERNLFLRGLVPMIGYKTACVYYDRTERLAGESKYPLPKMVRLAFDGITSFSVKPIHLVLYSGVIFILIALFILIWVLVVYCSKKTVPGWASLMLSLWFCSGYTLIGLGIIGEYIGKIYIEVKDRPRYNIETVLLHENQA